MSKMHHIVVFTFYEQRYALRLSDVERIVAEYASREGWSDEH